MFIAEQVSIRAVNMLEMAFMMQMLLINNRAFIYSFQPLYNWERDVL